MWYKIDSINHPKFNNFLQQDKESCAILRDMESSAIFWDKYLQKTNPIQIYYYEDSLYKIVWILKWVEHEDSWYCIGHNTKVINPTIDPYKDYDDLVKISCAFIKDCLTNKGMNKLYRQIVVSTNYDDSFWKDEQKDYIASNDWYKEYNNSGRSTDILITYGVKYTNIILQGMPYRLYELM